MNLWISPADVREFGHLDGTQFRYSDNAISSNIRVAQTYIERETGRFFDQRGVQTITLTSNGAAVVPIPDMSAVTAVTLQSAPLVSSSSYWLIEDVRHSGIYVAVQLRAFRTSPYWANPEWFDRGLDLPLGGGQYSSLPNDLALTGTVGWANIPADVLHAVKLYTVGLTLEYVEKPVELADVCYNYRRGQQAVLVG